jgi:hypothetical protein
VGSLKFNIELQRVSGRLIGVEYWATKGLQWAHWSSILSYRGSRMGLLEFNIQLWGSWVGSLDLNIQLWRVSDGLIEVKY